MKAVAILNSALEGQTSFSYSHRGAKRFGYNIGNSLIGVGLRAVAPDFEVVSGGQSLHSISNPAPLVDFLNRNFSRILVVLQDHVQFKEYGNPWALNDLEMKRLIKVLIGIQVPICFVSVTCRTDSLHNRTRKDLTDFSSELLEIFQRRDSVVLTRGRNSAEFLQTLGIENAHAASCPSIFVDVPAHGRAVRSHLVSTTGYLPIAPDFNEFYAHFVQGDGIEGPWRHLAARGGGFHSASFVSRRKLTTLSYGALDKALLSGKAYFPKSIEDWAEHLQSSSLVIGSRLHGTIMSLASGVPAICTGRDLRTRETLEALGLRPVEFQDVLSTNNLDSLHDQAALSTEIYRNAVEHHRPLFRRLLRDFVGN